MLKHAIPPTRFYSQTPNELIRHPRLTGVAVRLLQWALSLPDGSRETLQSIGEKMPEGRITVRKARRQLEDEGFVHTRRLQCPDSGRWTTHVLVSNVPLLNAEEINAAFGPLSAPGAPGVPGTPGTPDAPPKGRIPTVGAAAGQAVGGYPKGLNTEENTPNRPPASDALTARASALLARLGDRDARLRLGTADATRLAPLAARWLEDAAGTMEPGTGTGTGTSGTAGQADAPSPGPRDAQEAAEAALFRILTGDLPLAVRAPAALLAYRLRNSPPTPVPQARKPVEPLAECAECRDPLPRGQRTGICGRCAGVLAPSRTNPTHPAAPADLAVRDSSGPALVRAALRGALAGLDL
ncbi:hypothetical protein [Streptomyces sp. XD-27]|uniref:hypothetical protein n=1 Tax=Streptomyces sp. XD-27 TaxID=3062779 RepID=UPI0026F443C2|nr:hypothetical protein [Streptomyces sp. XD-27]WKX71604.1 hypothetical protein Q3Y56_18275 [Streptomyces sp. XD-27]